LNNWQIASKTEARDADRVLALSAGGISVSSIELGANGIMVVGFMDLRIFVANGVVGRHSLGDPRCHHLSLFLRLGGALFGK
jgi:hypothetical protein